MRDEGRIRSLVDLGDEERIVKINKTKRHPYSYAKALESPELERPGFFVLTTQRLLFYRKVNRDFELRAEYNLQDPISMVVGGSFYRYIIINDMKYFPADEKPKTFERLIRSTIQTLDEGLGHAHPSAPVEGPQVRHSMDPRSLGVCNECGFQNGANTLFCKSCGQEL